MNAPSLPRLLTVPPGYFHIRSESDTYIQYHDLNSEFRRFVAALGSIPNLGIERLWTIYCMARQSLNVPGTFFECGVYVGGTSLFLAKILEGSRRMLHLFDTFTGMPPTIPGLDWHVAGDFNDAPIEQVKKTVGHEADVMFHQGFMPDTFVGMEKTKIAFAHIDTDIYQSTLDCCRFVYPRVSRGGVMILDDYGQISCDGARVAIDEFFSDKPEVPLVLHTKQAVVFKLGD